jgi:hypothetical protein
MRHGLLVYGLLAVVPIIYCLGRGSDVYLQIYVTIYVIMCPQTTGRLDFEARVLQSGARVTCPPLGPFGPFGLGPSVFVRSPIRSKPLEWRSCRLPPVQLIQTKDSLELELTTMVVLPGKFQPVVSP